VFYLPAFRSLDGDLFPRWIVTLSFRFFSRWFGFWDDGPHFFCFTPLITSGQPLGPATPVPYTPPFLTPLFLVLTTFVPARAASGPSSVFPPLLRPLVSLKRWRVCVFFADQLFFINPVPWRISTNALHTGHFIPSCVFPRQNPFWKGHTTL